MVTLYRYRGLQEKMGAGEYVAFMEEILKTRCPDTLWRVRRRDADSVVYDWSVKGCADFEDQAEVARAVAGKEAMYLLRYTVKKRAMTEEDLEKWTVLLQAAALREDPA